MIKYSVRKVGNKYEDKTLINDKRVVKLCTGSKVTLNYHGLRHFSNYFLLTTRLREIHFKYTFFLEIREKGSQKICKTYK